MYNNHPLTSEQYAAMYAPSASELFQSAKLRSMQLNPCWSEQQHMVFAFSVLWLMGKSEQASSIVQWNYQRLAHMRSAANSATALSRSVELTPIGEWGFEAAIEFVISYGERRLPG